MKMLANIFPLHRFMGYIILSILILILRYAIAYALHYAFMTILMFTSYSALRAIMCARDSVGAFVYKLRINKNADFQMLRKTLVFVGGPSRLRDKHPGAHDYV